MIEGVFRGVAWFFEDGTIHFRNEGRKLSEEQMRDFAHSIAFDVMQAKPLREGPYYIPQKYRRQWPKEDWQIRYRVLLLHARDVVRAWSEGKIPITRR